MPATRADWEVDPFAGVLKDGYVYGRGAIDCKGVAIVQFLTLALLKRAGVPLKRDIIFLGTADEEAGGQLGAGWFVRQHFDLIADAEFLLTEGGGIRVKKVDAFTMLTLQRKPLVGCSWNQRTGRARLASIAGFGRGAPYSSACEDHST